MCMTLADNRDDTLVVVRRWFRHSLGTFDPTFCSIFNIGGA